MTDSRNDWRWGFGAFKEFGSRGTMDASVAGSRTYEI